MKCFNHPQAEAVGICRGCNKALCHDCLIAFEKGIACKATCQEEVRELIELTEKSKSALAKASKPHSAQAIFFLVIALFMAFISLGQDGVTKYFILGFASLSLFMAVTSYRTSTRLDKVGDS